MSAAEPKDYEPRSFADVLNAELHLIAHRRKVIFQRSTKQANLEALAKQTVPDPPERMNDARQEILDGIAEEMKQYDPKYDPPKPTPDEDTILARTRVKALDQNLAGLAFSGGGIRSATFAVGILQGLASLKLLRFFDVLSTVSGGGYAGGWLATWIRREGDPINVEQQLNTSRIEQGAAKRGVFVKTPGAPAVRKEISQVVDEEPEPIRHLRRYSSYLNPRPGTFTADTWTLISIYLRNALINLLLLIPAVVTGVLIIRLIFLWYNAVLTTGNPLVLLLHSGAGLGWMIFGFTVNALVLTSMKTRGEPSKLAGPRKVFWLEVMPLLLAAVLLTMTYQPMLETFRHASKRYLGDSGPVSGSIAQASYLSLVTVVGHMILFAVMMGIVEILGGGGGSRQGTTRWQPLRVLLAALMSGALAGVLISVTEEVLRPTIDRGWLSVLALAGPPLFLLVAVVGMAAMVALAAQPGEEPQREWWGRFGALLLMAAVGWVVCVGAVLYGPALVLGSHRLITAALASGWIGITLAGVQAGRSAATATGRGNRRLEILAAVAPPVFLLGLLALAATAVVLLVDDVGGVRSQPTFARTCAAYLYVIRGATFSRLARWCAGFLAITVISSWFVNVNIFSLHALYANRLSRAFLGASRRRGEWAQRWTDGNSRRPWGKPFRDQRVLAGAPTNAVDDGDRAPDPVTQFDPRDDLDLVELRIGQGDASARYWGPHVIFNTAMNLVGGGELAWRDRKGESFALTPLFCGARTTGYTYSSKETRENLTVGRAVAISGAAVDPNMNYHQSTAVTALLTVFNARLGMWIQNPNRDRWPKGRLRDGFRNWKPKGAPWSAQGASFGFWLFNELFGKTSQDKEYVHISDGGHFDNLGVYELVKRRCRYIVAVDAADDPAATSDNLGILVRLCRVDLGIRIDLDTRPLKVEGPDGLSRAHVVVGRVRYDDVDNGQTPGMLIYIKSTMTGDEPADVQQYGKLHPEFPRQLTVTDQSFDEDQFESYRALGTHTAINVFGIASQSLYGGQTDETWWEDQKTQWSAPDHESKGYSDFFLSADRKVFNAVRNRWTEPPLIGERDRIESSHAWVRFQETLRTTASLAGMDDDIYSDLPALGRSVPRDELHAMEQALRLMADTWFSLGLKGHDDALISAAHLNMFRRLAGSESFRRFWPLLRAQFSRDFVRFCERQLHAHVPEPRLIPAARRTEYVTALAREFAREWPECVARDGDRDTTLAAAGERYILTRVANGIGFVHEGVWTRAAFVIVQAPVEYDPRVERAYEVPVGIVILNWSRQEDFDRLGARFELLIWISRAQRSSGIGEKVRLCPTVQELTAYFKGETFAVRYPATAGIGGEDLNRVRWLSFFSLLGFKPHRRCSLKPEREWVLVKTY